MGDFWSLGVLLYLLLAGVLPYGEGLDASSMEVCKQVLAGGAQVSKLPQNDKPASMFTMGMLEPLAEKRLGAGAGGIEAARTNVFFKMKPGKNDLNKMNSADPNEYF